jgi:hypothetical protein
MRSLLAAAGRGLPALVGVLWGILLSKPPHGRIWLPVATAVAAFVILRIGYTFLRQHHLLIGGMLIEVWIVAAISVVALSTCGLLWLKAQTLPSFEGEAQKAAADTLVGAVAAYLALTLTKDISEGGPGFFWPGSQFKQALSDAFSQGPKLPERDTREWEAVYLDRVRAVDKNGVREEGPRGWGFIARRQRIAILRKHLREPLAPPAPSPGSGASGQG